MKVLEASWYFLKEYNYKYIASSCGYWQKQYIFFKLGIKENSFNCQFRSMFLKNSAPKQFRFC